MSLTQCFVILRARYRIVAAVVVVVMLLTALACVVMPKRYTAVTHVVIDLLSQDLVGGAGASLSANSSSSYIPTQVELIKSTSVAQKVVEKFHFEAEPKFHTDWLSDTDGRGSEKEWIAKELLKKLSVKPTLDSNILAISVRSPNASRSAAIANAFAQAYIETFIELRDGPARDTARWLEGRVDESRKVVSQAETRMVDFQKANNIVSADDRVDVETDRLTMLSRQLVDQQTRAADARARLDARNADGMLREVAQSPSVLNIQSSIADLQNSMSNAAATFGKNHPQIVQMRSRLAQLNVQLNSETGRLTAAVGSEAAAGALTVNELTAAIAAQKQHLIELKAQRSQLDRLIKERDAAETAYQDITHKYLQARLQANSVQSNISVLTPAYEPAMPSSPRPLLYLIISALVGMLLGCAAAFACEIRDRRIRSEDDIVTLLGVSSLGGLGAAGRLSLMSRLASWSNVKIPDPSSKALP